MGFESSKTTARELGIQLELPETEMIFKEKRTRIKKRHFDEDANVESDVPESAEIEW